MTEYAFPKDLLDTIKTRWQSAPDQQFTLPEDRILRRLLETCYHASLRTSEHRPVECVVAYASLADIPDGALQLASPLVPLTDDELVRLAPATQRHQTVIACDQVDGWLHIWGLFEYGHTWVQHSAGDPPAVPIQPADLPPDCLTIAIERPGALSISQGRTVLVRLRDGRLLLPQQNPFESLQNPLGEMFHRLIDDLLQYSQYRDIVNSTDARAGQRTLLSVYTTSILAILDRIRLSRHGGSLVIARQPLGEHNARITYSVSEHGGIVDDIVAYKSLNDLLQAPAASDGAAELQRCQADLALRRSSQHLIRSISRISLLAAVDGAVLLDGRLRIKGFGVRFPVVLPPGTMVTNAQTGNEYPCTQWGLRHQSIFSICHMCEQAIGLIVSQDGDVKAVKADDGQVYFWDGVFD